MITLSSSIKNDNTTPSWIIANLPEIANLDRSISWVRGDLYLNSRNAFWNCIWKISSPSLPGIILHINLEQATRILTSLRQYIPKNYADMNHLLHATVSTFNRLFSKHLVNLAPPQALTAAATAVATTTVATDVPILPSRGPLEEYGAIGKDRKSLAWALIISVLIPRLDNRVEFRKIMTTIFPKISHSAVNDVFDEMRQWNRGNYPIPCLRELIDSFSCNFFSDGTLISHFAQITSSVIKTTNYRQQDCYYYCNSHSSPPRPDIYLIAGFGEGDYRYLLPFKLPQFQKDPIMDAIPLIRAAFSEKNDSEILRLLNHNRSLTMLLDDQYNTPLHLAYNSRVATHLINLGANQGHLKALNKKKQAPLASALAREDWDVIKILWDKGARQVDNANRTLFYYANDAATTQRLIDSGVDMQATEGQGHTPLYEACISGHWDVAHCLVKNEAHFNDKDQLDPLMHSVNNVDAIYHLTALDCDIHAIDRNGHTPLFTACLNKHWEVFDYLWKQGQRLNTVDLKDNSPLHSVRCVEDLRRLIALGFNIDTPDWQDRPPLLHMCINKCPVDVVRELIQAGAQRDIVDKLGKTPLDYITSRELAQLFIDDQPPSPIAFELGHLM